MLTEIRTVYKRSSETILEDAMGAGALLVMMAAALYLPNFI
jgi:hypothetical protein